MDIQINIENSVSAFSYGDKQVISGLLSRLNLSLDQGAATVMVKTVAEDLSVSRATLVNCIKMLCCMGVISTENRGPAGTLVTVCNAAACRKILELCS